MPQGLPDSVVTIVYLAMYVVLCCESLIAVTMIYHKIDTFDGH